MPLITKYVSVSRFLFVTLLILWGFFASCLAPTFASLLLSEGVLSLLVAALLVLVFTLSAKRARVTSSSALWRITAVVLAICAGAGFNVLYALTNSLLEALTNPRPPPPTQLFRRIPRLLPTATWEIAGTLAYLCLTFAVAICMIRLSPTEVASATRTLAKIALALVLAVLVAAAALFAVVETKYRVETLVPSRGDPLNSEPNTAQTRNRNVQTLAADSSVLRTRRGQEASRRLCTTLIKGLSLGARSIGDPVCHPRISLSMH